MKRFILFAGSNYYPSGGWSDFEGSFDDLEEARKAGTGNDWHQVVDTQTWEEV